MSPLIISLLVFACIWASFIGGTRLRPRIPAEHFDGDAKFVVDLCIGMVAAMAALVLGLLTSSNKTAFDQQDAAVRDIAAYMLELDQALARYGEDTRPIRVMMKEAFINQMRLVWDSHSRLTLGARIANTKPVAIIVEDKLRELTPANENQKDFKQQALNVLHEILKIRYHTITDFNGDIPPVFLVVMTFWQAVLFLCFGVYAPRNRTIISVALLCALSIAGGVFVVLELGDPFRGLIVVSSSAVDNALSNMANFAPPVGAN